MNNIIFIHPTVDNCVTVKDEFQGIFCDLVGYRYQPIEYLWKNIHHILASLLLQGQSPHLATQWDSLTDITILLIISIIISIIIIIIGSSIISAQRRRLISFVCFSSLQPTLLEAAIKLPSQFNLLFGWISETDGWSGDPGLFWGLLLFTEEGGDWGLSPNQQQGHLLISAE